MIHDLRSDADAGAPPGVKPPRHHRGTSAPPGRMVVAGVCIAWLLIGVVIAAQGSLTSRMSGGTVTPFGAALHRALIQTLTWIPGTLAIIALAVRFPLTKLAWRRHIIVHVLAVPVVAFTANVLVVLAFWYGMHQFGGIVTLLQQGAHWTLVYLHIGLLVYLVVLAITHAILYYRRTRARELHVARIEGQLAVARLHALHAQIRPHFLFNTLHTIGQMWRSGRSDDADAVLDHLGNLFHRVQASASQIEVPLEDELDLVRQYLAIEQVRYRDRLHTSIDASAAALTCMVPPLLLQPIVENAVRHGVSAISTSERIDITAIVDTDMLVIAVRDDGPGISHATASPGSGMGLRNTRERIRELYGDAGTLTIDDVENGRGAIVRITIPLAARSSRHA